MPEKISIPVEKYFRDALLFSSRENRLSRDFNEWLPTEIIDSHAHSNTLAQCRFVEDSFKKRPGTTFPWFEISKHLKVINALYFKKKIRMLIFPIPYRGIDHHAANNYILRKSVKNSLIIPILCGFPDDIQQTISQLGTKKFHGLKMYPAYFYPPAQKISQYFPDQILEYCEEKDIPIILHLPSHIVKSRKELIVLAEKFPDLKIVLAHMGLAYLALKNLKENFSLLSEHKNIYLDTAMVTSERVFELALNIFGHHRIIFGTDQPLNLIRGKIYNNPILGARIATDYPYHWVDLKEQKEFSQYSINSVHFHWGILNALQKAIQSYGESKEVKDCIFRRNAKEVFLLS